MIKSGSLEIGPLRNLPVIKDLVVDMSEFFDKWARAQGRFTPPPVVPEAFSEVRPESPKRRRADEAIECIGCGVCYAACDVVAWKRDYLGPAALNRAWTLSNDVRDRGQAARIRAVAGGAGCHACHTHQSCAEWCPRGLNPSASIAGLKRLTALAALTGRL